MLSEYGLQVCAAKWRLRPRSIRPTKCLRLHRLGRARPIVGQDARVPFLFNILTSHAVDSFTTHLSPARRTRRQITYH